METPAGEQAPPPVPLTRREARRLREQQEAGRRAADPAAGEAPDPTHDGDRPPVPETPASIPLAAAVEEAPSGPAEPGPAVSPDPVSAPNVLPPRPAVPPAAGPAAPAEAPAELAPESRAESHLAEPAPALGAPAPEAPAPPRASHAEAPVSAPAHRHVQREETPAVVREEEHEPQPEQGRQEAPAGFIRATPAPPPGGFRGFLYRITGGALNLGPSEAQRQDELIEKQIARHLEGNWNTAFLSLKGGIGKTSTTVGVGLTLAELRSEPPCAIDANPDAGDLVERALGEGSYESERRHSITSLLHDFDSVTSRADVMRYLHHAGSLYLLAGEQDPELSDSLTAEDYRRVHALVARHFAVTLTDCGTGVSRPAMRGILEDADNIVVVAGYAVSGAKRARDTLRWLAAHGYDRLAQGAIVVVTDKDDVSARVDKAAIEATLSGMCRALVTVPHDRSMADGDLVDLGRLRPATRHAYREIAAAIVSGYQR